MKNKFLPFVSKPGRYLGKEYNSIETDWNQAKVRFALIFPDLYEIGMSHFGLQILYHILNSHENTLAERCFVPDLDAEKMMRQKNIAPLSLESGQPISNFDVLGITLPYELCYTNILTLLDLADIPFYSWQRNDSHPILIGGGSCSLNPEPVADFFDAILLGDGEEAVTEIADLIGHAKKENIEKNTLIQQLLEIEGVYVPAAFKPEYDSKNRIDRISPQFDKHKHVNRRIVTELNQTSHLYKPLVPNAKTVHDRLGIEIARGCTRGCRFCQAGMIYRPVRERTVDQIMDLARHGIENSGFEELALLSLSTGDYSCIDNLLPQLMDEFASRYVSVSMPSMRVGTLSQPVMDQIKRVRKTGFTVAPEAGSERLRRVINKGITEQDLLTTCTDAFSLGWTNIKLYFMIGLPTETIEDIDAIANLALKTKKAGDTTGAKRRRINVSVGTFVPKPHTPFQWEQQLSLNESKERLQHLKKIMPKKGCQFKWHNPSMSFLEGVFSRGDRRLARLIEAAWKQGARLDAWSEHFDLKTWEEAATLCDIDLADYLRARGHDEILPWHHLSSGIDEQFLLDELEKGHEETYTPDCRYHGCQQCGLCDFDILQPVVHSNAQQAPIKSASPLSKTFTQEIDNHFKYMVHYARQGDICYLGHLEILQLIFRSLRRANIRTNFSKGFNPSPKVSFGAALPVGVESHAEFFVMDLPEPLNNTSDTIKIINSCLPPGLTVFDIVILGGKIPQSIINHYTITLPKPLTTIEIQQIKAFQQAREFFVNRIRKNKLQRINIRSIVETLTVIDEQSLELHLVSTAGSPGMKAQEFLPHVLDWRADLAAEARIVKTAWFENLEG